MRRILLITSLLLAFITISINVSAQNQVNHVGPWCEFYDKTGNPYIYTVLPNGPNQFEFHIAFGYEMRLVCAIGYSGLDFVQLSSPIVIFGTSRVEPDDLVNGEMIFYDADKIMKLKEWLDSGECPISVIYYLNGERYTTSWHYRADPNLFIKAVKQFLD